MKKNKVNKNYSISLPQSIYEDMRKFYKQTEINKKISMHGFSKNLLIKAFDDIKNEPTHAKLAQLISYEKTFQINQLYNYIVMNSKEDGHIVDNDKVVLPSSRERLLKVFVEVQNKLNKNKIPVVLNLIVKTQTDTNQFNIIIKKER